MAHSTHGSMKARGHKDHASKVNRFKAAAGGHDDAPEDKKLVKAEIKKALGAGAHALKTGGRAGYSSGGAVEGRPSRRKAFAGGGAARKKSKPGNHVNIIIGGGGHHPPGAGGTPPLPLPPGAGVHPPMAAPPPAPPPAPMGARPPGMAGPPPGMGAMPPMRARGGRVALKTGGRSKKAEGGLVDAGSKSGVGRLEKAKHEHGRHAAEGEEHPQVEEFEGKSATGGDLEDRSTMKRGGRK